MQTLIKGKYEDYKIAKGCPIDITITKHLYNEAWFLLIEVKLKSSTPISLIDIAVPFLKSDYSRLPRNGMGNFIVKGPQELAIEQIMRNITSLEQKIVPDAAVELRKQMTAETVKGLTLDQFLEQEAAKKAKVKELRTLIDEIKAGSPFEMANANLNRDLLRYNDEHIVQAWNTLGIVPFSQDVSGELYFILHSDMVTTYVDYVKGYADEFNSRAPPYTANARAKKNTRKAKANILFPMIVAKIRRNGANSTLKRRAAQFRNAKLKPYLDPFLTL